MRQKTTLRMAYGGLLAAMIALLTAYVRLPVTMLKGYAHLGDLGIVLSALMVGPFAALPAALGSALADLLMAYPLYAPFSLLIKGLMGLMLGKWIRARRFSLGNLLLLLVNAAFMVGAYFLADMMLYGAEAALGSLVGNIVQGGAMVAGSLVLIPLCCSLPSHVLGRLRP